MRLSKFVEFKFGIPDMTTNVWSHLAQNQNALEKPMKLLKCVNKKGIPARPGHNDVQPWLTSCLRTEYSVGIIDR